MDRKDNYFKESLIEYRELRKENNKKPKLLLHVCCGACSCYPLVFLVDLFDITIFFSNSNIYPYEEYKKRLDTLKGYVLIVENKFNVNIPIIEDNYNYDEFRKDLLPYKDQEEGKNRCEICISKRMERLFLYASEHNYPLVSTVMSISRNKNVDYLNKIGLLLEKKYSNVKYFVSDFKKNGGQDLGVAISHLYNVYRQDYCGCEFSGGKEE